MDKPSPSVPSGKDPLSSTALKGKSILTKPQLLLDDLDMTTIFADPNNKRYEDFYDYERRKILQREEQLKNLDPKSPEEEMIGHTLRREKKQILDYSKLRNSKMEGAQKSLDRNRYRETGNRESETETESESDHSRYDTMMDVQEPVKTNQIKTTTSTYAQRECDHQSIIRHDHQ